MTTSSIHPSNGAAGLFQAVLNMSPLQPPEHKGRVPQYSRDKLDELQQKLSDLERKGIQTKRIRRHG